MLITFSNLTRLSTSPSVTGFTLVCLLACCACALAEERSWQTCVANLTDAAQQQVTFTPPVETLFKNLQQLPRVKTSANRQPEFTQTFHQYYQQRVTALRIEQGQELAQTYAPLLTRLEKETGVPARYLLALWGLETNYGRFLGRIPLPSALATLACDNHRAEFFKKEFLALLKIVSAGDLTETQMIGSWAGAVGHMQFMPTTYLAYAADGNGDGRKDIVASIPDALQSAAHYLAGEGWQRGYRWGREVKIPEGFNYSLTGIDQWRSLAFWRDLGITDIYNQSLPQADISAAVLLPSGYQGPVFLVYDNFQILMKWNRSQHYALSVGRLADRISGRAPLSVTPPTTKITRQSLIDLQEGLTKLGYETGGVDGVLGPMTRRAIRTLQKEQSQVADGYPSQRLLNLVKALTIN